jgi:hypothetical protein
LPQVAAAAALLLLLCTSLLASPCTATHPGPGNSQQARRLLQDEAVDEFSF